MFARSLLIAFLVGGMLSACGGSETDKKPVGVPTGENEKTPASGKTDPAANPDGDHGDDHHGGEEEKPENPVIMAHMMNRFVGSLSSKPTNKNPAPDWAVLLADPSNPIVCADCHEKKVAEQMAKISPSERPEGTEEWEQNTKFMKHLMKEWVEAVNNGPARKKLKADLTCKSCHEEMPK